MLPNYVNIDRPEGLKQQIVTLVQYVERYYPSIVNDIFYAVAALINIESFEPKYIPLRCRPVLLQFDPNLSITFQNVP